MNVKQLDIRNKTTINEIIELQRASYRVEADLIGFDSIPPLHDTEDSLIECEETFCGIYVEGRLAGMVSYMVEGGVFDIYRMAVHPDFFRRGIGSRLLEYVLSTGREEFVDRFLVSTGMKNEPARKLYVKHGFEYKGDKAVPGGLMISNFEMKLANRGA